MSIVTPPSITPLPPPPDPNNRSTFNALAYPWSLAQQTLATEISDVTANVYTNALDAKSSATSAASSATAADAARGLAVTARTGAEAARDAAAASAATALASPGTSATSTTSLTIGTGSKTLTIQSGKALVFGQFVIITQSSNASNWMAGQITSYNSTTGELTVNVVTLGGSGSSSSWIIAISGPVGASGSYSTGDCVQVAGTLSLPDWMPMRGEIFLQSSYANLFAKLGLITDGTIWSSRTITGITSSINGVAFGNGIFLAVGASGQASKSTDFGLTWTTLSPALGFSTSNAYSAHFANNEWIICGDSGKIINYTADLSSQSSLNTTGFGTSAVRSVVFGNNIWVAVAEGGKIATRTQALTTTWTQQTSSFGSDSIYGVAFGLGVFVAVGLNGKIATSTDGINWEQRTSPFGTSAIFSVAFGNNTFIAVSAGGKIAISRDGITWRLAPVSSFGTTDIYSVTFGAGIFVAVGDAGKAAVSPDGLIWSQVTSTFGTTLHRSVAYGNGVFVKVGGSGTSIADSHVTAYDRSTQFAAPLDLSPITGLNRYIKT